MSKEDLISFNGPIKKFIKGNKKKEDIVLLLSYGESNFSIAKRMGKSDAAISSRKQALLEAIKSDDDDLLSKVFTNNMLSNLKTTISLEHVVKEHRILAREAFRKYNTNSTVIKYGKKYIVNESFYDKVVKILKTLNTPVEIKEISEIVGCSIDDIVNILTFHQESLIIYFDDKYLYSFKEAGYLAIDALASVWSGDLTSMYKYLDSITPVLPKSITTYDKFNNLIVKRISANYAKSGDKLKNFLRFGISKDGLGTRRYVLNQTGLTEDDVEKIVNQCVDIANTIDCSTDTVYLNIKMKESGYEINNYLLKSILVESGEFIGGRKFNLQLKDAGCKFKTLYELINDVFNKVNKKKLSAREMQEFILQRGRGTMYENVWLVLNTHYERDSDNKNICYFINSKKK